MQSRRRNVPEIPQTIRRRSSRLIATDDLLLNIPIDVVIDIFSRLPLKSIARCRCVSKRWASVLRRPDFTELFFTKSKARPLLLLAFWEKDKKEVMFFSTPQQHQNLDEDSSHIAAVDHHMTFPFQRLDYICNPISGVFCIRDDHCILKGRKTREFVSVICYPNTRQFFTLPKMKTMKRSETKSFLGYDPIEKQHKVLAMTCQDDGALEHQVLTLRGNGNLTWRMIECGIHHSFPRRACVCINGVLYYTARISNRLTLVCFDVRYEKYSFVNFMERGMLPAKLINFQGKLPSLKSSETYLFSETGASLEMWILEDAGKHEWSKRIFNIPPMWKDTPGKEFLDFVGVTATNEFAFAHAFASDPFYVYYYNFVKEVITRVEIQGMGVFEKVSRVYLFLNHVEDVKLMTL